MFIHESPQQLPLKNKSKQIRDEQFTQRSTKCTVQSLFWRRVSCNCKFQLLSDIQKRTRNTVDVSRVLEPLIAFDYKPHKSSTRVREYWTTVIVDLNATLLAVQNFYDNRTMLNMWVTRERLKPLIKLQFYFHNELNLRRFFI